jgi:hypothetical protein
MTDHIENPDDDEPLDVTMSGSRGQPVGVATVLESAGELMRDMPDNTRYDFELSIEEVD